jgi:hypothetical protein
VSADWLPDPFGRHQYRYHDGNVWTTHVADSGAQSEDPPDDPYLPIASVPPPPPSSVQVPVATPSIVHVEKRYVCAKHGVVTPNAKTGKDITSKQKKASLGKIATGVMTGGASLLVTGVRSSKSSKTTILVCPMPMCGRTVTEL